MSEQIASSGPMSRLSQDDDNGLDPRLLLGLIVAGGIGTAAIAGYGVFKLFGHSGGAIPIIAADPRPVRVKPLDPGGMQVAPEEARARPGEMKLAPGTEEPDPHAFVPRPDPLTTRTAVPPPPVRTYAVQLSTAKTEAAAAAAWDKLAAKAPALFAHHRPQFLKTNDAGQSSWRLRTGGFADPAAAKAFCEQVKAKGGTCTVSDS